MDDDLSQLTANWLELKTEIEELYRQRKRDGLTAATRKGIDLFMQILYRSNNKSVCIHEPFSFSDLEVKPVNLDERLGFILSRPNIFPSFIQLSELMVEQEKLIAKKNIMKKASSQK